MLRTLLNSPSVVPETAGQMLIDLKLGTAQLDISPVLKESVELCFKGKTLAFGKLVREGNEVYVVVEEMA